MSDSELTKFAKMDDNHYQFSRSKSDSETLNCEPRSSKIQTFNKFHELLDLFDKDTVHDSPTLLANQLNSSLSFNQNKLLTRTLEQSLI